MGLMADEQEAGFAAQSAHLGPGFDWGSHGYKLRRRGQFVLKAENLGGQFGGLAGAEVGAGEDDGRRHAGGAGAAQNLTQSLDALRGEGAISIGEARASVLCDAMPEEVDLHRVSEDPLILSYSLLCDA
jgi:hypothetical protein